MTGLRTQVHSSRVVGTGISSIAQAHTVVEYYHQRRLLDAIFFFSRDQADRSDPRVVFSTIAYRLAILRHPFKRLSAYALDADLDLGRDSITKLIIEPLGKASRVSRPVVVVMVKLLRWRDCITN
jgi:hypothetical protein